jgi:hypothetical protein
MLLAGSFGVAQARPQPHDATGHWAGFFRSVDNPDIRGGLSLDVSSQEERRFVGELSLSPGPTVPVEGTIAESGEMGMVGRSAEVDNLTIEGRSCAFAEQAGLNPCCFEGRFAVTMADGSRQRGDVVAVHQTGPRPSSLIGQWFGSASAPDGADISVDATFSQDSTGAISGTLTWETPHGDRVFFVESAFGPNGEFVLVGGESDGGQPFDDDSDDALIALSLRELTWRSGTHFDGTYNMLGDAGSMAGSITLYPGLAPSPHSEIGVSPSSMSFTATAGGTSPDSQELTITNVGDPGALLSWSATDDAPWLTVDPAGGIAPSTTSVSAYISGLPAGTYNAQITIVGSDAVNTSVVPVTLTLVGDSPPAIDVSSDSLAFTGTVGGANPASQSFSVTNAGGGTLTWSASDDAAWLSLSPTTGTAPTDVTASVNTSGLSAGNYEAQITINGTGATNTPVTVPVMLTVADTSDGQGG